METTRIGIAGMGTVGKAVYHGFSPVCPDIKCYDKFNNVGDLGYICEADFVFICVPADQIKPLMDEVMDKTTRDDIVFILKSTVVPGTTEELQTIYGNEWVFNPEFLTERSSQLDFINSTRFILGGTGGHATDRVEDLFRKRFRYTPIIKTTATAAEFVKYMTNLFFMTKVSYMNEMCHVSYELGLPWDSVMKMFSGDGRIGKSHLDVPGPDGKRGFGGKCFPENINTYLEWTDRSGINNDLIEAVREVNDIYRKD